MDFLPVGSRLSLLEGDTPPAAWQALCQGSHTFPRLWCPCGEDDAWLQTKTLSPKGPGRRQQPLIRVSDTTPSSQPPGDPRLLKE